MTKSKGSEEEYTIPSTPVVVEYPFPTAPPAPVVGYPLRTANPAALQQEQGPATATAYYVDGRPEISGNNYDTEQQYHTPEEATNKPASPNLKRLLVASCCCCVAVILIIVLPAIAVPLIMFQKDESSGRDSGISAVDGKETESPTLVPALATFGTLLENGVRYGPLNLSPYSEQRFSFTLEHSTNPVICSTSSAKFGRFALEVSRDSTFSGACSTDTDSSTKYCRVTPSEEDMEMHIILENRASVATDLTIRCAQDLPLQPGEQDNQNRTLLGDGMAFSPFVLEVGIERVFFLPLEEESQSVVCGIFDNVYSDGLEIFVQLDQVNSAKDTCFSNTTSRTSVLRQGERSCSIALAEETTSEVIVRVLGSRQNAAGLDLTCTQYRFPLLHDEVPSEPFPLAAGEKRSFVFRLQSRYDRVVCSISPEVGDPPNLSMYWDSGGFACTSSANRDVVGGEYWCPAFNDGHSAAIATVSATSPMDVVRVTCDEQI